MAAPQRPLRLKHLEPEASLLIPVHIPGCAAKQRCEDLRAVQDAVVKHAFSQFAGPRGYVDRRSLKYALRGLSFPVTKAEAQKLFDTHARSDDTGLTLPEFQSAISSLHRGTYAEQLAKLYSMLDSEGRGHLTALDIEQVRSCSCALQALFSPPPPRQQLLGRSDIGNDCLHVCSVPAIWA